MKKVESQRATDGGGWVVRLFMASYADKKWYSPGFDPKKKKRYLIVRYPAVLDRFVPSYDPVGNKYWDDETYAELASETSYSHPNPKKPEKMDKAKEHIQNAPGKVTEQRDDFKEAEDVYSDWCLRFCDKTRVREVAGKTGEQYE